MKRTLTLISICLLLLAGPAVGRADISVTLKMDRSEATLLDSVRLVVSVSGTRNTEGPPILRGADLFDVRQGGTSTRVEIVNGKVNAGIDFTYDLQPKHTGTFNIGPAEISVKGRTYQSNRERLLVVQPAKSTGDDQGPLFLKAEISAAQLYVEEQAVYTLKLFRRVDVRDLSLSLPEVEHVTLTQLGQPGEYQGVLNGKTYQVLEVRYALVPDKEGTYALGSSRMSMTVMQPAGRSPNVPFNDPFFRNFLSLPSGRQMTLAGEPLELKVLALPREGRPPDFTGLVGSFRMESSLDPVTVKAGGSATLTVSVLGLGNVKHVPDLRVPDLPHTRVYADQPVLKAEQSASGVGGAKTMKWALVPENEGRLEIPPLRVSYFDTGARQYKTLETPAHALIVLPGEEKEGPAIKKEENLRGQEGPARRQVKPAKEAVKELGRDILPVHTSVKELAVSHRLRAGSASVWMILLVPVFIYAAVLGFVWFRRKSVQALAAAGARTASRNLLKTLRRGPLSAKVGIRAVKDYLNDRFGLSLGAVTSEEAAGILTSKHVTPGTVDGFRAVIRHFEDAVYTGKGDEICTTGEDLPKLIRQIEKEIR
ncbi:MAG: BatD family protein [Pseudomonadota bacterium]